MLTHTSDASATRGDDGEALRSSTIPTVTRRSTLPSRRWLFPSSGALLLALILLAGCSGGNASTSTSTNTSANTAGAPVSVPSNASDLQSTIINVVKTVQPSVVEVMGSSAQGGDIGSGEILTTDGYIVTNDHVVRGFSNFKVVLADGKTYSAQVRGEDPNDDLAVLKVNASNLHPISVGDSAKVQVGQFAIAIGSPLGLTQSATFGIVSALNRPASEGPNGPAQTLTGLIQTSAPINPGNSGGALVDLSGQLIGIPTLGAVDPNTGTAANGIGFAIPSDRMQFIAQQIIKTGKVSNTGQGFLGVEGTPVTPQLAQINNLPVDHGFIITGFVNDTSGSSPAKQAGLQQYDIITAVNGQQITGQNDLSTILINDPPGTQVKITYQRGNSSKTVTVTLGQRPANPTQG